MLIYIFFSKKTIWNQWSRWGYL